MTTAREKKYPLCEYDLKHIPVWCRICSPYFTTTGYNETKGSGEKSRQGKTKLTAQQKKAMSNQYDMYQAMRVCGKVVKGKLLMSGATREEIKGKYGLSPNTIGAAARNGAVTKEGYHFIKIKQGRKHWKQLNLFPK